MKSIRWFLILMLTSVLSGCGGHGYEGEFEVSNEILELFGSERIVIGSDFVEASGQRQHYDDIFVRDSDGDSYLVFKDGNSELAWRIVDRDTLVQGVLGMEVFMRRVD